MVPSPYTSVKSSDDCSFHLLAGRTSHKALSFLGSFHKLFFSRVFCYFDNESRHPLHPSTLSSATTTTASIMAPRTRSISKAIQDVVVCAPLTTPASLTTTPCLRDFPCIGCLIVLVNWIPEDGKIFPCSDSERKIHVPSVRPLTGLLY